MPTFTHHSARATVAAPESNGLVEVFFTGLLDARAFAALQSAVMRKVRAAPAVVLRYDKAAVMVSQAQPVDHHAYLDDVPVMAIVVAREFVEIAAEYAANLGQLGVIAAVFSDSAAQIRLAYQWAARHALVSHPELPA